MRWGTRPEHAESAAAILYEADGSRYHAQNALMQLDMAAKSVGILGLRLHPAGAGKAPPVLEDLGCDSGLSTAALQQVAGNGWVGLDITPGMLCIAASEARCAGHLALSDLGQGLPLRSQCLDGAISISAVQWLCSSVDPQQSLCCFFSGLHRALKPGACATLQVYGKNDGQAQQLVTGARHGGLAAGLFVAFPHASRAKKYFVMVHRPARRNDEHGRCLSRHNCNLAWPKSGSCIHGWMHHLRQQKQQQQADGMCSITSRMQQEHGSLGRRMLQLMRRAERLKAGGLGASNAKETSAAPSAAGPRSTGDKSSSSCGHGSVLQVEVVLTLPALMPCGGAIFLLLTAAAELLSSVRCCSSTETVESIRPQAGLVMAQAADGSQVDVAAAGPDDLQQHISPAVAIAKQLLQVSTASSSTSSIGGSSVVVHVPVVQAANADDSTLHLTYHPLQQFVVPPLSGSTKAFQFMLLEPFNGLWGELERQEERQPVAAVLHPQQMSQHLVLRFSCRWQQSKRDQITGPSSPRRRGNGNLSSSSRDATQSVPGFCAEMNGSVIAVDAHLHADRLDSTWLLFVRGAARHGPHPTGCRPSAPLCLLK